MATLEFFRKKYEGIPLKTLIFHSKLGQIFQARAVQGMDVQT